MTITAIETRYAGCRFRSRLEARWAVFFDHLGLKWEYEPQGYVVNGKPYLPDFLLPDLGTSVEVKGDPERLDLALLADAMDAQDWAFTLILGAIPNYGVADVPTHTLLTPVFDVRPSRRTFDIVENYSRVMRKLEDPADRTVVARMVYAEPIVKITAVRVAFIASSAECAGFMLAGLPMPIQNPSEVLEAKSVWPLLPLPRVKAAYEAARSARFEHGETP